MKVALLGAKWLPSAALTDQMVMPLVGLPSASVHVKAAPPQSCTSMPRCFLYQAHRAFGSLAFMKMPPMPVTLRMQSPSSCSVQEFPGVCAVEATYVHRFQELRVEVPE